MEELPSRDATGTNTWFGHGNISITRPRQTTFGLRVAAVAILEFALEWHFMWGMFRTEEEDLLTDHPRDRQV